MIHHAMGNALQLETGACGILDGDTQKTAGPAVFNQKIIAVFFFPVMKMKRKE